MDDSEVFDILDHKTWYKSHVPLIPHIWADTRCTAPRPQCSAILPSQLLPSKPRSSTQDWPASKRRVAVTMPHSCIPPGINLTAKLRSCQSAFVVLASPVAGA